MNYFQSVTDWAADPYDGDMDAIGWFLFIGLIVAALIVWNLIINKIVD